MITFPVLVKFNKEKIKTNVLPIKGWNNLTKSISNEDYVNYKHTGILTGEINDITVIDFDFLKINDKSKDGIEIYTEYIKYFKDTFIEKSISNNGYHAYFKFDKDMKTTTKINGYSIDVLNNNKFVIQGTPINNNNINIMPEQLKNFLMNKKVEIEIEDFEIIYEDNIYEDIDKVKELVEILTEKESNDRDIWIKVGIALYNILENKDEAKDIFNTFSKLSNKYNLKDFNKTWNSFNDNNNNNNLTINSICNIAKIYNNKLKEWNEKYNHIKKIDINIPVLNKFNNDDDYNFLNFKDLLFNNIYDDENDLLEYLKNNLHKVCVRVADKMIIKNTKNDYNSINKLEEFNIRWRKEIKCKFYNKDKKIEKISLLDYLEDYPKLINSFTNINSEFITRNTINNKNDFYVSQEFPTMYIDKKDRDENVINYFLTYIKEIICNNDEESYKFLLKWLSFIINNPNYKSGIALVLISKQGTGKGRFVDFLTNFIFGKYNCKPNLVGINELLGQFNNDLLGKKLIVVNEMASNKDNYRSNFDKLKSLITDTDIKINTKYLESFDTKQSFEFILCSNHMNSLSIEDNDRRLFVLNVNEKYKKNTNESADTEHNKKCIHYWLNYNKTIMNQESANNIYSYFVDMNINLDFIGSIIPYNELKQEIKDLSKQGPEIYIDNLIISNDIRILYIEKDNKKRFKVNDLYEDYKNWCVINNEKILKNRQFISIINKYDKVERIRSNGTFYCI